MITIRGADRHHPEAFPMGFGDNIGNHQSFPIIHRLLEAIFSRKLVVNYSIRRLALQLNNRRTPNGKVSNLSLGDGIFAVAMTLLVLDLKLPEGITLNSDSEVWRQLLGVAGRFWTYVLSFIVLGMYWVGHHALFHSVHRVNRTLLWLNLLFLLFVTLVPFSINLVSGHSSLQIPVVVYGLNLLATSAISLLQLGYLAKHPNLSHQRFAIIEPARQVQAPSQAASIA
jgi:uncharacterized membrane protein